LEVGRSQLCFDELRQLELMSGRRWVDSADSPATAATVDSDSGLVNLRAKTLAWLFRQLSRGENRMTG
jgi:hypothetical protein